MSPYPKWVQGVFGKGDFGQKVHVPFGTKETHFGEYRTKNSFWGQKKNPKGGTVSEIKERALLLLQKISPKKIPTFNINSLIGII